MTIKNTSWLFSVLLLCSVQANACTIFMKCVGSKVLVGNNEDYMPSAKSWLWIRPKTPSANGFMLWGFKEKYPEGGINDKGLFFDAAALPEKISIIKKLDKPDFEGYITEKILRECATVEQAVNLVGKYNLSWQEKAQIMVVDKSGDYAIIHANYIVRKKSPAYTLTNHRIDQSGIAHSTCWRRNTVEESIFANPLSVDHFRKTLAKTSQHEPDNATVYSQVCDLEKGIIYLYQKHNFNQVATISLSNILQKGRRTIAINTLFPKGIGAVFTRELKQNGMVKAIKTYTRLKQSSNSKQYDFSEGELEHVAYSLLNDQKFEEAIRVFRLNIKSFPSSANAKAGLANALLLKGNLSAADQLYTAVSQADPSNPYFHLFSRHKEHLIPFVVKGFDGAKSITVFLRNYASGLFITQNLKSVIKGHWETSIIVPPGQYTYTYMVDNSYVIDPHNQLTKLVGRYQNSFLISR